MDHVQHGDNVQHGENVQQVQNVGQAQNWGQRPKKPESDPFWRYDTIICRYELWIIPVDLRWLTGPQMDQIRSICRKLKIFYDRA